ncbi:MAG: hypothetical protein NXI29_05420 [bacterium]|nr:hypothetical protein [bacterium]
MTNFSLIQTVGPCLDKVLQDCGSEIRDSSVFFDVHFLKPVLSVDLHNTTDKEVLQSVRDYCYEMAGKFREAGMNVQQRIDQAQKQSTPLSELIGDNVHFTI